MTPQSHSWKTETDSNGRNKTSVSYSIHIKYKKNEMKRAYRWDPAPPELMLSASLVAADASERLEPDWALLRLSAMWNKKELINVLKTLQHHYCILLSISMKKYTNDHSFCCESFSFSWNASLAPHHLTRWSVFPPLWTFSNNNSFNSTVQMQITPVV